MPPSERQCRECGEPFAPSQPTQLYCCALHQKRWNSRQRYVATIRRESAWTPERTARLCELLALDTPRPAIARELGMSKNAVIGKSFRLGLNKPKRPPAAPVRTPDPFPGPRECRHPIGHPRKDGFHFCAAAIKEGSPYCPEHHALCYVPAGKPMAEAA